jgi:hypothetical protein
MPINLERNVRIARNLNLVRDTLKPLNVILQFEKEPKALSLFETTNSLILFQRPTLLLWSRYVSQIRIQNQHSKKADPVSSYYIWIYLLLICLINQNWYSRANLGSSVCLSSCHITVVVAERWVFLYGLVIILTKERLNREAVKGLFFVKSPT